MRRIGKSLFFVSLLGMSSLVLAPTPGHAVAGDVLLINILNTSPIWADSISYHACNVVNVTTAQVTLSIELINSAGTVIQSVTSISIPPGTSYELAESAGTGFARCRFSLNDSPAAIRANATVFFYTGTGYQTYAFSEAR